MSILTAIKTGGARSQVMMSTGATLFFLSDLVLSNTYFGTNKDTRPYIVSNHALYYLGQFMIAMSVFFFK
ncbi:MAG: lysoplasmalogenase, partial [Clostridia bacterium]|nr:lysoplasmalogenase [Clostridia bacterium]